MCHCYDSKWHTHLSSLSASSLHPSERMKDSRGACPISITINSATSCWELFWGSCYIRKEKHTWENVVRLFTLLFLGCYLETPRMFVCFLFVCRGCRNHWTYKVCKACRTQKFHSFNLQILFLSLLPLALRELLVLLCGEGRCTCLSSQPLVRWASREERSLQWKGEIEDWNGQKGFMGNIFATPKMIETRELQNVLV